MAFRVYILFSPALRRHYVGFSSHHARRVRQHRRKHEGWSAQAQDWTEVWNQEVPDRASARKLEVRVKARGARRFLAELDGGPPAEDDAKHSARV
jgi:putative endonuclease